MAALNFGAGAGLRGGVKSMSQPRYGSVPSPRSATEAAYGPSFTSPTSSMGETLKPNDPFGIALWVGVGCAAALIFIYTSLPN
jgi:hypothetical protein